MPSGMLVTDADNTLWDTNKVFAEAQMLILDRLESLTGRVVQSTDRLAFIRQFDEAIAREHQAGLKYPPKLLIDTVTHALGSAPLSSDDTAEIIDAYFTVLAGTPTLRVGVRSTLEFLVSTGITVIVATEGSERYVANNLMVHELDSLVSDVVFGIKNRQFFEELYARESDALPKVCVGDQLDRDIEPSKAAGFTALYFPGGFRPSWEINIGAQVADRTINSYVDVKSAFALDDVA